MDRILDLRRRVAGWLPDERVDLWQSPLDRGRLAGWVEQGAVLVQRDGDRVVGTVVAPDSTPGRTRQAPALVRSRDYEVVATTTLADDGTGFGVTLRQRPLGVGSASAAPGG
jgi:hypothetical protein